METLADQKVRKMIRLARARKDLQGGEIRGTKTLNLSRNIVSLQVLGGYFAFFTLRDQLVALQKHLFRTEERLCEK